MVHPEVFGVEGGVPGVEGLLLSTELCLGEALPRVGLEGVFARWD